jgi:hypothetical protein
MGIIYYREMKMEMVIGTLWEYITLRQ